MLASIRKAEDRIVRAIAARWIRVHRTGFAFAVIGLGLWAGCHGALLGRERAATRAAPPSTGKQAAPRQVTRRRIPRDHLERFGFTLATTYPRSRCLLEALMGDEYATWLREEYVGGSVFRETTWEAHPSDGVLETRHHYDIDTPEEELGDHRVLWMNARGRVIVALRRSGRLRVWASHGNPSRAPPTWLRRWVEENLRRGAAGPVAYRVRRPAPGQCWDSATDEAVRAFVAASELRGCTARELPYLVFGQFPTLVRSRVCLHARPQGDATRECLTPGDLIQLARLPASRATATPVRQGRVCAYYRAPSGHEHVGWLPIGHLSRVSPETFEADWRAWTDGLPPQPWPRWARYVMNSPGRYVRPQSFVSHFELLAASESRVRFDVDQMCSRHTCPNRPFDVPLENPRLARDRWTTLVRFNNALYFTRRSEISHEWRIFYPVPRPAGARLEPP